MTSARMSCSLANSSASDRNRSSRRATKLLSATENWENGVIEGPTVTAVARPDGSFAYFIFYGASYWDDASAGIGYATCTGPTGPCTKVTTDANGGAWMKTTSPGPVGPSGPTFFVAPGVSTFATTQQLAYHGWYGAIGYPSGGVRALWRDAVDFSTGIPVVVTG